MTAAGDRSFRLDIQGLRALAVLLVFFAHAGWAPFSGGFIGVDVFFVISGYVITGFLLREYEDRGELRLRHFYARRLQRLLPALVIMVLLVSLVVALLLSERERAAHLDAGANALLWVSNFFFYFMQLDYFDAGVNENLFLHTWTLGVEEQFYLLWPLLLTAGLATASRRLLPGLLVGVVFATFGLCLYWAVSDPNAAFYLVPARGWQFAIGGLVAWWHHGGGRAGDRVASIASPLGLGLILSAAILLDAHSAYPRLNALAPTLGAAMLLLGGGPLNRLLSAGPAVWLGNVSYGFYLWHWPVLLLFGDLRPFYPGLTSTLALALTILLAALSYYLVEQPLRTDRRLLSRPGAVIAASGVTMLAAILVVDRGLANYPVEHGDDVLAIQRAASVMPQPYLHGCDDWYRSAELKPCTYGDPDAAHTAVLLGDSIGLQWFAAVEAIVRERGWRLLVLTKSACPMVDYPYYYRVIRSEYTVCAQWRDKALVYIAGLEPDLLLIGSDGEYPFSQAAWREGSAAVLERLAPHAGQVALLAPSPRVSFDGPGCLARRARLAQLLPMAPVDGCREALRERPALSGLRTAAEARDNVDWIDMTQEICPGGICSARRGDDLVYRDQAHLAEQYVLSLKTALSAKLDL
jgi:peptidoglycan/LPS O-acetylase OafA/YrhL